jgi:hypothetical protein
MYDFMINHVSSQSVQYQGFIEKKDDLPMLGMFLGIKRSGPAANQQKKICTQSI